MAWPFEKGADLIVQLHMQTTGKPELVQPTVALYFTNRPPRHELTVFPLMVRTIDIPPGASDYKIHDSYKLPVDVELLWIMPHAHYLAKEMKAIAHLPDGSQKWLLYIRQWDFNWQGDYAYREPIRLPQGTEISMDYTYDNSAANPRNPSHPPHRIQRIQYGQQTTDEMGELWLQAFIRREEDRAAFEADFKRKTLSEIVIYYEHRLKLDQNDAKAHCRLGFAQSSLGKRPEAVEHFRKAIQLDPRYEEPHLHLGMIYYGQGNRPEAAAEFQTAHQLNPRNYLACGYLGLVQMELGQLDAAEASLRTALHLNPNDPVAQDNLRKVLQAKAGNRR
jgi:tetratricopeptide (TPR) repeat protein